MAAKTKTELLKEIKRLKNENKTLRGKISILESEILLINKKCPECAEPDTESDSESDDDFPYENGEEILNTIVRPLILTYELKIDEIREIAKEYMWEFYYKTLLYEKKKDEYGTVILKEGCLLLHNSDKYFRKINDYSYFSLHTTDQHSPKKYKYLFKVKKDLELHLTIKREFKNNRDDLIIFFRDLYEDIDYIDDSVQLKTRFSSLFKNFCEDFVGKGFFNIYDGNDTYECLIFDTSVLELVCTDRDKIEQKFKKIDMETDLKIQINLPYKIDEEDDWKLRTYIKYIEPLYPREISTNE